MIAVLSMLTAVPSFAGTVVVGSVAGGTDATVGSEKLVPGYTLFSGDNVHVQKGQAFINVGHGTHLVFGQNTSVSLDKGSDGVTAYLSKGSVSLVHPGEDSDSVRLKIGNLMIVPGQGFATVAQVAATDRELVISTASGMVRVEADGKTIEIPKGKAAHFVPKTQAPQQAGAPKFSGGHDWVLNAFAVLATTAIVLAIIALSRSNDAIHTANQAKAAAEQANQNAIAAGCALDLVVAQNNLQPPSPFVPVGGTCPGL
jgi:hypothetical protein